MESIISSLLIPSIVTGVVAIISGILKIREYYICADGGSWNGLRGFRCIDFLMWVAVFSRLSIGLLYLFWPANPILNSSDRAVLLRFLITLMFTVEIMRTGRKMVVRDRIRKETISMIELQKRITLSESRE